jgi:hypothetical protein
VSIEVEMNSAWERFHGAVLTLVRSGAIKDRLAEAYREHLGELSEEDLPRELREEFRDLQCTLTREPAALRGEDAVRATLRKMSALEAEHVAASVVRLFAALPRSTANTRLSTSAQVVPLYLAEA